MPYAKPNVCQPPLFGGAAAWMDHWRGMPEYSCENLLPSYSVKVNFLSAEDMEEFGNLLGQKIGSKTKSVWFPAQAPESHIGIEYTSEVSKPAFPIYIVSKGRAERQLTASSLMDMGIDFRVIVELCDYEEYSWALGEERVLLLPQAYKDNYDTCLADKSKSTGSGAARNYAWDHSIELGYTRHWVMDDNIDGFHRLNRNLKVPAKTGAIFCAMEHFALRYDNVALAGPAYSMFAKRKDSAPAFVLNTRLYSCILIKNDIPFRWRGRYNEDVDLSLRVLKSGLCTVQFNAFLQNKVTTQTMSGGNTTEFYAEEGTAPKTEMLVRLHPDVAKEVFRFGRVHHHVDYSPFKRNALILSSDPPAGVDEFGMSLKRSMEVAP